MIHSQQETYNPQVGDIVGFEKEHIFHPEGAATLRGFGLVINRREYFGFKQYLMLAGGDGVQLIVEAKHLRPPKYFEERGLNVTHPLSETLSQAKDYFDRVRKVGSALLKPVNIQDPIKREMVMKTLDALVAAL